MQEMISKIEALLAPLLEGTDMFVTNLQIEPGNNIKLFLDADEGLNVQKSVSINRQLVAQIDELGWYPNGDYSLEVSSPGVDEPLRSVRQYQKNIGRTLAVTNVEDLEQIGVLKAVTEVGISLEVKINKKKETALVEMPFENIKQSIVQVIF
ncbi:MAG: ribosome maturation factor [Chitinophagia bacterium]|jgi:ribosome maturation factor RimP|nr:ribosome maturation factor [Chitinophagia bacterium]